ncbi:GNAT family N-acetyltransferase [Micromonospora sp. NBC_01796]|uniref:GNAT family N-acetyltransferase n=1 Tax=Micromonospora sp. NBC_01796 TaxID=2975987 RepID=UPI002DD7E76C|nr:GNAT family N-acetyltransferase [Micromonospora sp. NBC_01796]WSA83217.1 GNAT family N-acetyltransferase [Micromonospora sp. NBC_01796]
MSVTIREFRLDSPTAEADTEAAASVLRAVLPYLVVTPRALRWQVETAPEAQHHRLLLAEADGQLLGCARTGIYYDSSEPGQAYLNIYVHPDRRGRGAGRALLAAGEAYVTGLDARTNFCWSLDDDRSIGFAERNGYRRGRSAHFQRLALDDGSLPPMPSCPPGVEVRTGASFGDDLRGIWVADNEAAMDEPDDVNIEPISYDVWLSQYWLHPEHDRELTSVVTVDGEVAAFSLAITDGDTRYMSGMAGTRRAYRRRGLAKLAKSASLHRAGAAGYTEAFTNNDSGNEPMLAINKWFGYQECATEVRWIRDLTG